MAWTFHDANARPIFEHYRVTTDQSRGKRYGYRHPLKIGSGGHVEDWCYRKPQGADSLLYRLPSILRHPWQELWLTEGERDADALVAAGVLASSHHQAAGHFTEAQAESIAGHRGQIILVVDRDLPGAYDAARRYDLLRAVGLPAARLSLVHGRVWRRGADARDHFEAGHGLKDFVKLDIGLMHDLASQATPADYTDAGYFGLTPDELSDFRQHGWQPLTQSSEGVGVPSARASSGSTRTTRERK